MMTLVSVPSWYVTDTGDLPRLNTEHKVYMSNLRLYIKTLCLYSCSLVPTTITNRLNISKRVERITICLNRTGEIQ